jgi:transcription elongation factor SPT6
MKFVFRNRDDLIQLVVLGISHRKPQGAQLDQANPVRNDETGLWQCPFCLKNDFPELSEVCLIL